MEKPSYRVAQAIYDALEKAGLEPIRAVTVEIAIIAQILDEQAEEIAHLKERLEKVEKPANKPFDRIKNKWAKEVKTLYENRCLHKACENCHGTGRGENGVCVHAINCHCSEHSATC